MNWIELLLLWHYSPFVGSYSFFSFFVLYTVGRIHWTGDQHVARPLPTHRTTQTQNKRKQTSMLRVGFVPMIPAFEGAETIHDLDLVATVTGFFALYLSTLYLYPSLTSFSSFLPPLNPRLSKRYRKSDETLGSVNEQCFLLRKAASSTFCSGKSIERKHISKIARQNSWTMTWKSVKLGSFDGEISWEVIYKSSRSRDVNKGTYNVIQPFLRR
jgi:hypothetical protein